MHNNGHSKGRLANTQQCETKQSCCTPGLLSSALILHERGLKPANRRRSSSFPSKKRDFEAERSQGRRITTRSCKLPSGTMTRRRSASSTPQPAKRPRVEEGRKDDANGSSETNGSKCGEDSKESRPFVQDTPQTPKDDDDAISKRKMAEPRIELPSSPVSPSPAPRKTRPRRAAADKASAVNAVVIAEDDATASVPSKDTIHKRLFAPITEAERKAWQGWSDIESEPAFFNFILKELGVHDATIFELFGVDESSISYLP